MTQKGVMTTDDLASVSIDQSGKIKPLPSPRAPHVMVQRGVGATGKPKLKRKRGGKKR